MNGETVTSEQEPIQRVLGWVEYVALGIELLAVAVIAVGVLYAVVWFLMHRFGRTPIGGEQQRFRAQLGNSLLVGLEILVAADIIRTVALEPTLTSVAILGVLVLVRTFLSWSLVVEMEGRWPWEGAKAELRGSGNGGKFE